MKELLKKISKTIRSFGFKGSGQNFYKIDRDVIMIVNFQKSSGSKIFYINIGVHPLVMLHDGDEAKKVKEYECMFRDRIDPPDGNSGWKQDLSELELNILAEKMHATYTHYFEPLSLVRSAITLKRIDEIIPKNDQITIYGGYHAKTCRDFSILADKYGQKEKAIKFAQMGLKICRPQAKGLIADLNKLSKIT